MITTTKPVMSRSVDEGCAILPEREGRFWVVLRGEDALAKHERFQPREDTVLKPIASHHLGMLGLPA